MIPRCPLCSHQHWPGMPHLTHDSELEQISPKLTRSEQTSIRMREYWAKRKAGVDKAPPTLQSGNGTDSP